MKNIHFLIVALSLSLLPGCNTTPTSPATIQDSTTRPPTPAELMACNYVDFLVNLSVKSCLPDAKTKSRILNYFSDAGQWTVTLAWDNLSFSGLDSSSYSNSNTDPDRPENNSSSSEGHSYRIDGQIKSDCLEIDTIILNYRSGMSQYSQHHFESKDYSFVVKAKKLIWNRRSGDSLFYDCKGINISNNIDSIWYRDYYYYNDASRATDFEGCHLQEDTGSVQIIFHK